MSDLPPTRGLLQQNLECPVCLDTFNLQDRIPTALYCLHTVCQSCVDTLADKPPIICPICKRSCDSDALRKNYGMCDIIESLCHSCTSAEIVAKCDHCEKKLCTVCLGQHLQIFEGDVKQNMQQLRQEVEKSEAILVDEAVLEEDGRKATATIEKIQICIARYQDETMTLSEELQQKVMELNDLNLQDHTLWQEKLAAEIEKCKTFLGDSEDKLGIAPASSSTFLVEINTEILNRISQLQDIQTSTPLPRQYDYVEPKSTPDVGKIESQSETILGTEQVRPQQTKPVDYTHARSLAVSGDQGSGPGQFAGDGYVACAHDRYIVSDRHNHRINIYDKELNLTLSLGERDDQNRQFYHPSGLCASPSGDLFVSDSNNNRVKKYDKYYHLIKTFGSKGCGDEEMTCPMGLALTQTGELVVAEFRNYRLKVLTTDMAFIRNIGSKGEAPGEFRDNPVSVAITSDGHILVNEKNASRLLAFSLDGDFVRVIIPQVPQIEEPIKIWGFATDPQGNIIIADEGNHQLVVIGANGQLMSVVGSAMDQPLEMRKPINVATRENKIIVYEAGNKRIQVLEVQYLPASNNM